MVGSGEWCTDVSRALQMMDTPASRCLASREMVLALVVAQGVSRYDMQ